MFLRLDCQTTCVCRRLRPRRHLLDPAMRQPRTISHRYRRSKSFQARAPVYETLHAQSDQPPACRFAAQPAASRLSIATNFSASSSTSSHHGQVVREMPIYAANLPTYGAQHEVLRAALALARPLRIVAKLCHAARKNTQTTNVFETHLVPSGTRTEPNATTSRSDSVPRIDHSPQMEHLSQNDGLQLLKPVAA